MIPPVFDLSELCSLKTQETKPHTAQTSYPEEAFVEFDGKLSPEVFQKEVFKKYEKSLQRKAPLALKLSMKLMDEGEKLDLDKGLKLELSHLKEIFSTKDAYVGLDSVLKKTRPEFTGA